MSLFEMFNNKEGKEKPEGDALHEIIGKLEGLLGELKAACDYESEPEEEEESSEDVDSPEDSSDEEDVPESKPSDPRKAAIIIAMKKKLGK